MSGFDLNWLDLREAADLRARNAMLKQLALAWLGAGTDAAPQLHGLPLQANEMMVVIKNINLPDMKGISYAQAYELETETDVNVKLTLK